MFPWTPNGQIVAKLRAAGATEPGRAVRYHPADEAEEAAFRGLLEAGWVLEAEPAHYYTNEPLLAPREARLQRVARWVIPVLIVLAGIAIGTALLDRG